MKAGSIVAGIVAFGVIATSAWLSSPPSWAPCTALERPMDDQELISSVVAAKAIGDFQVYFGGAKGRSSLPKTVDRFDTVAEFLAAYPACCEVHRLGRDGYSTFDIWRWLRREVWPVVGITYPKIIYEDGMVIREEITREYFELDPCGELVNLT